ncbi:MAG: hypothetical protein HY238_24660 [Acidobacteria bacterium]|nr:hypothetical protein [Acidobacteriota bacterium]
MKRLPVVLLLILLAGALIFVGRSGGTPQLSSQPRNLPNTPGPSLEQAKSGRVAWMSGVMPLGDPARQNDFPFAAAGANGDIWAVWSSYSGLREEIHARRFSGGAWYVSFPMPGVSGDVSRPQVALDGEGKPWFAWSQQVDYPNSNTDRTNWDLFAARLDGDQWTGPVRLTDDPLPDIYHRLVADSKGKLWLVWQGFRNGQSDIFLKTCENGKWSEAFQVTSSAGNDWSPDVAVDRAGNAVVVWDSYRNGNYDVYMRAFRGGQWGAETLVAGSADGETNPSAVFDQSGRLWVTYENIGPNWGKDSGGRTLGVKSIGTRIGQRRSIQVKVLENDRWMAPEAQPGVSLGPADQEALQTPRLYCDAKGRIWLLFRNKVQHPSSWSRPWQVQTDQVPIMRAVKVYWNTYVTYYDGSTWAPATALPNSRDRISSTMAAAPAPNGQFWVFWHTDNRDDTYVQLPQQNQVWSSVLTPATPVLAPKLAAAAAPGGGGSTGGHADEAGDVKQLRSHTVTIDNRPHHVYRGDLHRHTEFSTDGGGSVDGSVPDFFRYTIDAADLDFSAVTDHSAGGDVEYWWWLIQKMSEMHQVPGRYLSLYGYERTATYPNGHRNVIHPYRNVPVVKFHFRADVPEYWSTYEVLSRDLVNNDTKLLYEELKKSRGIAVSHTSATNMGTDWRDNNPEVEPVVEIFQGARVSYEHEGAPAADKPDPNPRPGQVGSYQPKGFVWNAWAKRYRLGVIANSDHGSTHLSYAMVYSDQATRAGIIESIRKRHTYAATDNILLEYWMGDHFMGDEFTAGRVPELRVKIRGTAPVRKVSIIRNNKYIGEQTPGTAEVAFSFRDNSPVGGTSYYYLRVEQADGQMAWSSPIWVTVKN